MLPCLVSAADWAEYRSEHFTVFSDEREASVIEVVEFFETFRSVFEQVTGRQVEPRVEPLRIVLYGRGVDYHEVAPPDAGAFFALTNAGPRIVIGPGRRFYRSYSKRSVHYRELVFHEYVHYLMLTESPLTYPHWYHEGFAYMLGAARVEDGEILIGTPPQIAAVAFRSWDPLQVEDVLDPGAIERDSRYLARYYATSWLLTRFLQIGDEASAAEVRANGRDYLRRFADGEHPIAAFERSFGMSTEEFTEVLQDYRDNGDARVLRVPVEDYGGGVELRKLSRAEAYYLRGDMAWRVGNDDTARWYLEKVSEDDAGAARGLSLLAVLINREEPGPRVRELLNAALRTGADDPIVRTNVAHVEWENYQRSVRDGEPDAGALSRGIEMAQSVLADDPTVYETHVYLARMYGATGDHAAALRTFMDAYRLRPVDAGLNLDIGRYLVEMDRRHLALRFLDKAILWAHDEPTRREAELLLAGDDASDP